MHRTPPLIALGLLLVASMVAGCDRTGTATAITARPGHASASTQAHGADGAPGAAGSSVRSRVTTGVDNLPAAWPVDVALPPGSHVGGTAEVITNGVRRMAITGTTPLDPGDLRRHFDRTLRAWEPGDSPWADGRTATWARGTSRLRVRVDRNARGHSTFEATVDA